MTKELISQDCKAIISRQVTNNRDPWYRKQKSKEFLKLAELKEEIDKCIVGGINMNYIPKKSQGYARFE